MRREHPSEVAGKLCIVSDYLGVGTVHELMRKMSSNFFFFSTCHPYAHRSKQAVEEVGSCYNDSADRRAVDIKAVAKLPLGASR